MSGSTTCDWCGQTIDDFSALNKMLCYGLPAIREWHLHLPRDGYECMERAVEAFDKICGTERPAAAMPQTDREDWRVEQHAFLERCHAWEKIPPAEREHQILNALDDARLCARDRREDRRAARLDHAGEPREADAGQDGRSRRPTARQATSETR
jgi:hypothetical protein